MISYTFYSLQENNRKIRYVVDQPYVTKIAFLQYLVLQL